MKRNPSIEVFRCLLMYGICLLHVLQWGGAAHPMVSNVLTTCVTGFVVISGFFGIKFSWRKVFKLCGISLYCGIVALAIGWYLRVLPPWGTHDFMHWCKYILYGQWFFISYLVLMCCAPMLNYLIENVPPRRLLQLAVPLCFVALWSWLCEVRFFRSIVPVFAGAGGYTPLMMITVYSITRFVAYHHLHERLSIRLLAMVALGCGVLLAVTYPLQTGIYQSPLALTFMGVLFLIFTRLPMPRFLGVCCAWIAPSTFSIYLLHAQQVGAALIRHHSYTGGGGTPLSPYYLYPLLLARSAA